MNKIPDMCETCESSRTEAKIGHDTYKKAYCPYGIGYATGTRLWFCSIKCLRMTPVPTIDDGIEPGITNLMMPC